MTCVEIGVGDNRRVKSRSCHCSQISTAFMPTGVAVERNLFWKDLHGVGGREI